MVSVSIDNRNMGLNPTNYSRKSRGRAVRLSRDSWTTESRTPNTTEAALCRFFDIDTTGRNHDCNTTGSSRPQRHCSRWRHCCRGALASSAHATCEDLGGTFAGGKCTVVTGGTTNTVDIAGPSGRIGPNPWTQTTTQGTTTDVYHGNGPGALISSSSTPDVTTTNNPGGHEVSGVPGGGAP
jgi:hypothetical protein